jgi:exodeoxyribonuclease V alpha subunit
VTREFSYPVEVLDRFFRADDGAFAVLYCRYGDDERVVVAGPVGHLDTGDRAHVTGTFEHHTRHGEQVRAAVATPLDPDDRDGQLRLLERLPGIGSARAKRLVDEHGEQLFAALDDDAESAFGELPGVGTKRSRAAADAWREARTERDLYVLLAPQRLGFLTGELIERHGKAAASKVRANPYLLTAHHGVGFLTADRLALALGVDPDSPERAQAAIVHTLAEAGGRGHVFLPSAELLRGAARLVPQASDDAHIDALVEAGALVVERDAVYRRVTHAAESEIAARLVALDATPARLDAELPDEPQDGLSLDQWHAVRAAFATGVSVLIGGPGTGKTTTTRAIVAAAGQAKLRIALCAPTGRAAERLSQVTGAEAATIHRLIGLGFDGIATHDEHDPLDVDIVLVDEVSMVDQALMLALLRGLDDGTHLVLVGDADQLPSVAAGRVLADIVTADQFLVTHLTEIFRQAARSLIVRAAHAINGGRVPNNDALAGADADVDRNYFFMVERDPERLAALVGDLVATRLPAHYDVAPTEIQVLAPMRRGRAGVHALNALLQDRLNPDGSPITRAPRRTGGADQRDDGDPTTLRVGDKALQTARNDYELELMNGTLLDLVHDHPERKRVVAVDESGRTIPIPYEKLGSVRPAYAMTVHKAQGCEWPVVVLALSPGTHPALLSRPLLYTAVTRARRAVVVCGDPAALERSVANADGERRYTRLASRIAAAATLS